MKSKLKWIIAAELVVLSIVAVIFICKKSGGIEALNTGIRIEDFSSRYIAFDNGWYIDEDTVDFPEDEIDMIYGPFTYMPKGDYTLVMSYDSDSQQDVVPYSSGDDVKYIRTNTIHIEPKMHDLSYDFSISKDIENFEVRVRYNGSGSFYVKNIGVYKNLSIWKKIFFILFVLFLTADIALYNIEWVKKNIKVLIALLGVIALISVPLILEGMHFGHDIGFHVNRIEGIAGEIRNGNIPARMLPSWGGGYGYAALIFYGNVFLYIPAFFRIIGFTVTTSYKMYVFAVNVATVFISYYCLKRIIGERGESEVRDNLIALLCTLAYAASPYRMMNVYVRAAVGEYTAMAFYPLVALAMYLIYTYEEKDKRKHFLYATLLAFGMSCIIECHTLSTLIVIELLVLFCLLLIKKTIKPGVLADIFLAIGEAFLMNLFFIVPFLDYSYNGDVRLSDNIIDVVRFHIQSTGADVVKLLSFFHDPFAGELKDVAGGEILTPGMILILAYLAGIVLLICRKSGKEIKFLLVYSTIIMFMATMYFPWDFLAENTVVGNYMAQIEFPWRYLAPGCLILSILLGFVLEGLPVESEKASKIPRISYLHFGIIIPLLSIIYVAVFTVQFAKGGFFVNYYDAADIEYYDYGEFLRAGIDKDRILELTGEPVVENAEAKIMMRRGTDIETHCVTYDKGGTVTLPLMNYKGYYAVDDKGSVLDVYDNEDCCVTFDLPVGYDGIVYTTFKEPWYWRLAEIISLCSILATGYAVFHIKREERVQIEGKDH